VVLKEQTIRHKHGRLLTVEILTQAMADGNLLEIVRNISGRKPSAAVPQAADRHHRPIVDTALDPIFTADADGRYLYVNRAAAAMMSMTPEELVGKTVDDLFAPDMAERFRAGVRRVIQTGEILMAEDTAEINGQTFWFSTRVQPLSDTEGRISVAQVIVRDITSLKQAERALQESETRLRQAVRVANIGIFEHEHIKNVIYLSPELRQIYGLAEDEMPLGDSARGLASLMNFVHPEDRERLSAVMKQAHNPAGDGQYDVEHRHLRPDGGMRWLITRSQTFFGGQGKARYPVRTVGAVIDITERKQAEEERDRLQAQLNQAQKMESIGRLAGGVAHDFNNMLAVIIGYADLTLDQLEPSHPSFTAIQGIRTAAKRSADLTRQLLGFARKQAVTPRVLNLNDAVAQSLKMLGRLIGENIKLVWMQCLELSPVNIDPAQVDQILANLAANSRDAISGSGRITIRTDNIILDDAFCESRRGFTPGRYVMVEVADDGHGMDAETQRQIFEPFYTTKSQGTGLGLSTVYGIVKQNSGFIDVMSKVGRGTTIQVFLPPFSGDVPEPRIEHAVEPVKAGSATILLVEDEPMVLDLTKMVLESLGHTVLEACTPGEALQVAGTQGHSIQLLITDVVMPEMSGHQLAVQLLRLYPHLKCIFMSGYFDSAGAPAGLVPGEGTHILQKPFLPTELAAAVRNVLA
jgi:two-component system, cell cycle sensor histidine kinase and response regulator CckA